MGEGAGHSDRKDHDDSAFLPRTDHLEVYHRREGDGVEGSDLAHELSQSLPCEAFRSGPLQVEVESAQTGNRSTGLGQEVASGSQNTDRGNSIDQAHLVERNDRAPSSEGSQVHQEDPFLCASHAQATHLCDYVRL